MPHRPISAVPATTTANTAATTTDNASLTWAPAEYRPSAQAAMDSPGRCAYSYGSEG
jgi:hypothetical protein